MQASSREQGTLTWCPKLACLTLHTDQRTHEAPVHLYRKTVM